MGPLQSVLWEGGGFATAHELVAAGATPRRLRTLVESGKVVRPRRGIYAFQSASPTGLTAVTVGGRLAGLSAAASYGLWGGWAAPLTVCVRRNASLVGGPIRGDWHPGSRFDDAAGEFVVHWNDDPADTRWCWRVSVDRCVRQVLAWNDAETATAVVDTALTAGHVDHGALLRATEHSGKWHEVVSGCRAGSGSGIESIARQRLEFVGLVLDQQVTVEGVGIVDLCIRGSRVLIEIDGFEFHSSPEKFADDRRREAEARARGLIPLRFTALHVRDQWPWVERMVLSALAQSRP